MKNNQKKHFNTKHGYRNHRLYDTWRNMIKRCYDINNIKFNTYGKRGIKVCDRWHSVENFINDMYPTYQEGLTLDRKNNDLGYNPDNCRWVEKNVQSRNTRKLRSTNTSGYRGIYLNKQRNKWACAISINCKTIYLGLFITPLEAAKCYDDYIIKNNLEHTKNFND